MPNAPRTHKPAGYEQAKKAKERARNHQSHRKLYMRRAYRDAFDKHMHAEQPLCVRCLKKNIVTFAEEKHHTRKLSEHPEDLCDSRYVEHLCKACHSAATARGE